MCIEPNYSLMTKERKGKGRRRGRKRGKGKGRRIKGPPIFFSPKRLVVQSINEPR